MTRRTSRRPTLRGLAMDLGILYTPTRPRARAVLVGDNLRGVASRITDKGPHQSIV